MKYFYSLLSLSIIAVIATFCIGAFYSYFYPMDYKDQIVEYSQLYGIDAGIVASVANVESGFNENALSSKGARGVMQLIPSTAEWLAGKLGEDYSEEMLYNGEFNIKLGSFYLAYLVAMFGNEKTAICAYNAGQGNVKNWLKSEEYSRDGKTLKKIPFAETKEYLNKVLKNYEYYKNRYKNLVK